MNRCKYFRPFSAMIFSIAVGMAVMGLSVSSVNAAAGGLDNSLDGNGKLATDFNNGVDTATDVLIQPDGKIVVAGIGNTPNTFTNTPVVARYNVNGSLDTTFGGGDGRVVLTTGTCLKALLARDSIGRIMVATCSWGPTTPYNFHLYRLTSGGDLDTTFSTDGRAEINFLSENFALGDVIVDSQGRIIVVGGTSGSVIGQTPPSDWVIWRFTTGGSLDTGFNGDGVVTTDFGGNLSEYAVGVAMLPNGKMIVGGNANPGTQDFALALYTTNGSLDTSWGGGDGKVVTDLSSQDIASTMKLDPAGKIVLAGRSQGPVGPVPTIMRYNADGSPDNTFDGDGIVQDSSLVTIQSFAIQFDGKIVVVGRKLNATNDFFVARRNANGSPDTSFGNGGAVTTDMNNGSDDDGKAVAIQLDRRIVVVGSTLNTAAGSTKNFCVARYLPTNVPYQAPFDFDGDGKSDYGIFRPGAGQWWINRSSNSSTPVYGFGSSTDRIAPADFTGDGKTDIALFRPSTGQWFILRSENSSFYAFPFGTTGDIPVPGDYDGDGEADAAVFRPSNSTWFISQSSGAPTRIEQFGINGDQPVVADYDEDGKADVAIFRPGPREWWIQRSTAGLLALQFGNTGDKPVQGDYTGDGKADIAIFRPTTGEWFVVRSDDFSFFGFPFGAANDVPAPADYDGDGRIDPTVVRGAQWFIGRSTGGTQIFGFGTVGDRPIPNAFVP